MRTIDFARKHTIVTIVTTLLCLSVATPTLADDADLDQETTFHIAAQPLDTALLEFSDQADLQVMVAANDLEGIRTEGIQGTHTPRSALSSLLDDTGLEYQAVGSTITVSQDEEDSTLGKSQPASSPVLIAQNQTSAPQNRAASPSGSISDQEYDEAVKKREEIVVTGSRIRGAQSASPTITFTQQEIDRAGFATVEEMVDKLPQNFGAGATQDTVLDPNAGNAIGGAPANIGAGTSVNLRGLGASSTLILLNGRRMNPSGGKADFTDISGIPVTAIERVEVLTDGASAIYGSDAIGGVVNFILRDDYEGAESRLRYGSDSGGDTSEILFGQTFGKSWNGGNALLSYEYYQRDQLDKADRDFTSTDDLTRFGGTDWREAGGNPANIMAGGQTFAIPTGQNGTSLTAGDFDPTATPNRYNSHADAALLPEQERHSAFLHLKQKIGSAEFFAAARFSTRDFATTGGGGTVDIDVPNTNPFFVDPTGTGLTTVRVENYAIMDDLGAAFSSGGADNYGGTIGVRFEFGNTWSGELAGNWSGEQAGMRIDNRLLDRTALDNAVNQTDPELAFNPFGDGSNTNLTVLDTIRASLSGREISYAENELWSVGFHVDGETFDLPGGAVKVATGIGFRYESLLDLGDRAAQAAVVDLSRDVTAVYAELWFPLVSNSNRRQGVQRLEVSLAARYEDYSDFGGSTNPKVGLVWSPTQALMFRGTWGTSFKAPMLVDLNVKSLASNPFVLFPQRLVDIGLIPFPALILTGGNENLNAEKATTWTAGIEWSPESVNGLSLDLTYFNIDFDDRIGTPFNNFAEGLNDPRFASLVTPNPTQEQIAEVVNDPRFNPDIFGTPVADILSGALPVGGILDGRESNLSRSVVTGLEVHISYGLETTLGSFDIGFNGNYLLDFERQFIAAAPLVDEVDTLGRPIDFRARGSVTWSRQGWSTTGFLNYIDGYTDNVSDPGRAIDSYSSVDLTVSYDVDDGGVFSDTQLSLTVQNVFNEDPPFADTFEGLAYDNANHNPMGRFLSFQVTKEW